MILQKIVSGGQTGADRAALDWAIEHQIPHGGWCPQGRKAEDGIINARYNLIETPSPKYSQRTEWNVRDSDGTVVFSIFQELFEGTLLTVKLTQKYGKPYIHICRYSTEVDPVTQLISFLLKFRIKTLNIAGTRASDEPEIYQFVKDILERAIFHQQVE